MIEITKDQLEKIIDNLQDIRNAFEENLKGIGFRDDGLLFDGLIKTSDLLRELEHAAKNTDKRADG